MPTPKTVGHAVACVVAKIVSLWPALKCGTRVTILAISVLFYMPYAFLHSVQQASESVWDIALMSMLICVVARHAAHDIKQLWACIAASTVLPSMLVTVSGIAIATALVTGLGWHAVIQVPPNTDNPSKLYQLNVPQPVTIY